MSPDGRWAALTQGVWEGTSRVFVLGVEAAADDYHEIVASFETSFPDEAVFSADGRQLYWSSFIEQTINRADYDGETWRFAGGCRVDVSVAGLDVDGEGRVIVAGFWESQVAIVDARSWPDCAARLVDVGSTSYELCADPRPGTHTAWAVTITGATQVIDTRTATILAEGRINDPDDNGLAMSCQRSTGQPYLVNRGQVWTWRRD